MYLELETLNLFIFWDMVPSATMHMRKEHHIQLATLTHHFHAYLNNVKVAAEGFLKFHKGRLAEGS